jgi:hypothetical protein
MATMLLNMSSPQIEIDAQKHNSSLARSRPAVRHKRKAETSKTLQAPPSELD